jgi:hypothetical protein
MGMEATRVSTINSFRDTFLGEPEQVSRSTVV